MMNPHCEHCLEEKELTLERDIIEFLKNENMMLRNQNIELVKRLTYVPEKEVIVESSDEPKKVGNPFLTWRARRQALEREDRAIINAMRDAAKPDTVENLESSMGIEPIKETKEDELGATENL